MPGPAGIHLQGNWIPAGAGMTDGPLSMVSFGQLVTVSDGAVRKAD
jgi:hypothetical protein